MEVFMKKDKKNRVLAYMAKWWYLYLIGFAAMVTWPYTWI